ncbi:MAG: hypothetical protein HYZ63_01450 [Candidatus Andersenbacteria bacterium]|nr:hypothetical protein [Candidatus Andersenbacteria bacterium]
MDKKYVFFLGRQWQLSAVEVWHALVHTNALPTLMTLSPTHMIVQTDTALPSDFFDRLGGVERVGEMLDAKPGTYMPEGIIKALSPIPEKFQFGLSTIGVPFPGKKFLVDIKKSAKKAGGRLSFVEPKEPASRLSSAQVLFNGLYRAPNTELTIIGGKGQTYLVRTIWVQDIAAYEARDTGRPARDAYVGMLSPKLAQTMISLAVHAGNTTHNPKLYDPFCGLGTILQEGYLAGYTMVGSDKEKRMVDLSRRNLNWILKLRNLPPDLYPTLFTHDATQLFPSDLVESIAAMVTEPFLGTPLSGPLSREDAKKYIDELYPTYKKFIENARNVLVPHGVILLALPAVKLRGSQSGFYLWPKAFLDEFAQIGYLQEQLVPVELAEPISPIKRENLLYARPDANIGRELTLWRKQ